VLARFARCQQNNLARVVNGVQAVINDNRARYVRDDTPDSEARYRAHFTFSPNSISMASGDTHILFAGRTGTRETEYFDIFESRLENYIGPAARGPLGGHGLTAPARTVA
jgi:hypothetical protein